jgi:F-type H+-transporting ATPase subunit a
MSSEHVGPKASEYIVHHLTHLNSTGTKQTAIVDWSVINLDTLFWSVLLGVSTVLILARAAARATSGVPGRFQGRGRDDRRDGGRSGEGHHPQ